MGPAELAHALDTALDPLAAAVDDARSRAHAELAHRDEVWAPLARRLGAWHDAATATAATKPTLDQLTRALQWLTDTSDSLRDERLAPFADASQRIWQTLRQQSNVDLDPVKLDGKGSFRHVVLAVRIDGTEGGAALGVMSQGELHALGLSLFLPRATVEQSPFRFVLIDDPVQAMDPAKVDGLAQVLAEVAVNRQVVVFTHDDRLADAVRRLEIPATVWEVQRGEKSVVELRHTEDPVSRYLDDARAMARTDNLPPDLRGELVARLLPQRRRGRFARQDPPGPARPGRATCRCREAHHRSEVDQRQGDVGRARRSAPRARSCCGRCASHCGARGVDALQRCRQGAHHGLDGDLRPFVKDVERLAEWIQR